MSRETEESCHKGTIPYLGWMEKWTKAAILLPCLALAALFGAEDIADAAHQNASAWVTKRAQADGLTQRIFRSRIVGQDVSYHVFVPPSYEASAERRYPVLYWLHGSHGGAKHIPVVLAMYRDAIREGVIPPMLIVFPNGLDHSMWVDAADGSTSVESVLVRELIPDVDDHFRTIASRQGRMIEGFSMGGYGALHLAFKYPHLFGAVSSLAGGPLQPVFGPEEGPARNARARARILDVVYGGDQDRFYRESPWHLAEKNAEAIKRLGMRIRLVVGDQDEMMPANVGLSHHLEQLGIGHAFVEARGAGHNVVALFAADCRRLWLFYGNSLAPAFHARTASTCPTLPTRHRGQAERMHSRPAMRTYAGMTSRRRARIAARLQSFDSNGDGLVQAGEVPFQAMRAFRRIDRDGNGVLDSRELDRFARE